MKELQEKLNYYGGQGQLDSIGFLIEKHLAKNNLNTFELQFGLFAQGNYYKLIGKHSEAILALKKAISLKGKSKESKTLHYKSLYVLSDIYFTRKEFKKAFQYAYLCRNKFSAAKNTNSYIITHLITGYYYYLNYEHKKSLQEFLLAEEAAKKYDPCNLAEVYVKTARIYSREKQLDKAKKTIEKSINIADSCGALENKINALRTLREILVEHGEFEGAHKTFEKLDRLVGEEDAKRRNIRIDSFEIANKTKFKEQQNANLKRLNKTKEEKLKQQKNALIALVSGVVLLIVLLYLVIVLKKRQAKTNAALQVQKEEIELKNKDLKRLNLLHQKIFTVISHDFKEPITTLRILLNKDEIVRNENKIVSSYIKAISQQLEQSDGMLTSLLDWAKMELVATVSPDNEIRLYDHITIACKELLKQAKAKNIKIENDISKDTVIVFNPMVLSIVLRNIINNAIKFSYEDSTICIEYADNEITVKDSGKGIEQKKLQKLFKQNINPGIGTNLESGFGIGLYLCQELMLKNKGTLDVLNNESDGCTFIIVLPK
ncbi:HAMP domain-containing sensor histidine kinase [Flavobacterium sp. Fl-318]|uniref:histidine kinase n=1 Tax=Flavobacterium cupriresistens TaxID=2893885 RepID=A0ABU4RGH5_9FLAO|nr:MULTISPECIES: HAMP domain-containing sensor histidine kinase [unclassified Flavobacterium]MDX6191682.1 HAMP domain-containing sensor histidine kinase [Flavobacterium sp. Fl-318]UFH41626.1 HAMP domain-containing histidine kinase [Flavobacterium sp. F-323]